MARYHLTGKCLSTKSSKASQTKPVPHGKDVRVREAMFVISTASNAIYVYVQLKRTDIY